MNKNVILIGGAVVLLGAGAYVFFKNKKKTNVLSDSKNLAMSELVNVEQSAEAIKIKQDIKDLASSIKVKKDNILNLENQLKSGMNFGRRVRIIKEIKELQNPLNSELAKLKELGYAELNGNAVKIG
jgi:LPXTG-motif cell wall-anchored protein